MNTSSSGFPVAGSAALRPGRCAPSGSASRTRAAVQAVLVVFLAWSALLCAGLGGTVGAVSQTLVSKLAASAQHLQRGAGTSMSSRSARGEATATASVGQVAQDSAALTPPPGDAAAPAGAFVLTAVEVAAVTTLREVGEAGPGTPHRTPPSRAPPSLA